MVQRESNNEKKRGAMPETYTHIKCTKESESHVTATVAKRWEISQFFA